MNYLAKMKLSGLLKKAKDMADKRQVNPVSDVEIEQEVALLYQIAEFYDKHQFDKDLPHAELLGQEVYRTAAALNDANAQYILSNRLIEKAKFWQAQAKGIFSSNTHQKYAEELYREAFAYLKAAEEQQHALAKRLHGLAYINGWGVTVDQDRGFKLVVESIDQEGTWDQATQIFEELGLNKPDFFASIMSIKQGREQ